MKAWLNKLFARELNADTQAQLARLLDEVVDSFSGQSLNEWLVDARQGAGGRTHLVSPAMAAAAAVAGHFVDVRSVMA